MTEPSPETRAVVVEREMAHPPERIWRALTQPHLIEAWLMKSDFKPTVGRPFSFTADWGGVACEVLEVEPQRTLSYTWAAMGLSTVVTWSLTPTAAGTHLRMEQCGFPMDQDRAYQGAAFGWRRFLANLEQTLAGQDGPPHHTS